MTDVWPVYMNIQTTERRDRRTGEDSVFYRWDRNTHMRERKD